MPPRTNGVPRLVVGSINTITVLGVVAAGIFVPSWGGRMLDWMLAPDFVLRVGLLWFALLVLVLLAIAVHEAGHVLGGWLAGFTFGTIRVSLLMFDRVRGLSVHPSVGAFVTGESRMRPPVPNDGRARYAILVAGGPAANVIAAVPFLVWLDSFGTGFAVVSLLIAILDLVPMETGFGVNDGMRLRMLFFQPRRGARWIATCRLLAESEDASVPDRMSPEHLAAATAVRDPSRDTVSAHALAYAAAMVRQSFDEAGAILDVCVQYSAYATPDVRSALASDAACYQAGIRRNPQLAQQWLQELPPHAPPWLRLRAEVTMLEAEGDLVAAWRKLDAFEQQLVGAGGQQPLLPLARKWKGLLQEQMPPGALSNGK